jgi:exosortase
MAETPILRTTARLLGQRPLFLVLLIAHLPLAGIYYLRLWSLTHYQFFPFALGLFVWLVLRRAGASAEKLPWISRGLLVLDVALLGYAYLIPRTSPLCGAAALVLLCAAWLLTVRESGFRRSLLYLAILPALTLRLPRQMDDEVIQWLQRGTTSLASQVLSRMGILHARQGVVLEMPGKQFLVAEACSGVQSLFTILFLAAVIYCLKRRSLVHGICLLASGFVFSGMMNVARVLTITLVWDHWQQDLSAGILHDVLGYTCLGIAALLLLSADAMLGFLGDPVPDVGRPGAISLLRNPLVMFWNSLMLVRPESRAAGAPVADPRPVRELRDDDSERRRFPRLGECLSPANWSPPAVCRRSAVPERYNWGSSAALVDPAVSGCANSGQTGIHL